jgi:hypothetical protein
MSVWVKAEFQRGGNRRGFALHHFDLLDIWDINCEINTVDILADKLKLKGIVPAEAYLYGYEYRLDEGVHRLYFLDKSFKELVAGEHTPIQYVTGNELRTETK